MRNLISTFCIVLFLLLSLATASAEQRLRIAINATSVENLDPHMAAAFQDRVVVDMLFNGLLRYKPGNSPHFEPDLAVEIPEPWIKGNKQVWTFQLKRGVMFHAGPGASSYELTADDVVYSLGRAADPARSRYAGEYKGMTVEKVDDYTCNIIMDQPLSPVLFFSKVADYSGGFIVSKRAVESLGDQAFSHHPVGTGPFHFIRYDRNLQVVLGANELYFRGRPKLKEVSILFLPDTAERYLAFSEGQADVIRGDDEIHTYENFPRESIIDVFGVPELAQVHFNTSVKPLDDIRVRRAIAYALDRDAFLRNFNTLTTHNIYSAVPKQYLPGGLSAKQVAGLDLDYPFDLSKARALLAEAGYRDGFTLDVVASKLDHLLKNYQNLREQLKEVGIRINLEIVDHAEMHRLIRQNKSALVIYEAWRLNTDMALERFFHSDSIVVTGKHPDTNFSHYRKIDDLIVSARQEMDQQKQIRLWEYAQTEILEDMVAYPLHGRKRIFFRRDYVDYGHILNSSVALYPQITEKTRLLR